MSTPPAFGELAKGHRSRHSAALLTPRAPGRTSRTFLSHEIHTFLLASIHRTHSAGLFPNVYRRFYWKQCFRPHSSSPRGAIPDGTPPPPAPPKPEYQVAAKDVLDIKTHQQGGRTITLWSSADFALIAGRINSFEDSAGETHYLLMGWGNVDFDRMSDLNAVRRREYKAPAIPDFPAGNASYKVVGTQAAAADLVSIPIPPRSLQRKPRPACHRLSRS